jgi:hypothetical protein
MTHAKTHFGDQLICVGLIYKDIYALIPSLEFLSREDFDSPAGHHTVEPSYGDGKPAFTAPPCRISVTKGPLERTYQIGTQHLDQLCLTLHTRSGLP